MRTMVTHYVKRISGVMLVALCGRATAQRRNSPRAVGEQDRWASTWQNVTCQDCLERRA